MFIGHPPSLYTAKQAVKAPWVEVNDTKLSNLLIFVYLRYIYIPVSWEYKKVFFDREGWESQPNESIHSLALT